MTGLASGSAVALGAITIGVGALIGGTVSLSKYIGSSIQRTVEWNSETKKLAAVLNTTQAEATALAIALDDSFVSSDTYLSGVNKLTKGLEANETLLKKMGVALRESDGSYRNTNDLMLDTLTVFSKMEGSTERNIALQKIFGKSWQEMLPALEVAKKIENAREEVEKFGLATDPKTVKAYRESLDDVGDVFEYLKISVGKEFMPIMTELLTYLGELGKAVLPSVITGIKFVANCIKALIASFKADYLDAKFFFEALSKGFLTVGSLAKRVLVMDFSGAKKEFLDYSDWLATESRNVYYKTRAIREGAIDNFTRPTETTSSPTDKKTGYKPDVSDDKEKKAAQLKAEKELLEYKLACYDRDIEAAKGNFDEQIKIARERQALIIKTYGAESKEAIEAAKVITDLEKQKLVEIQKINDLRMEASRAHAVAEINLDNQRNEDLLRQNLITGQELVSRKIENNEKLYSLELQGLQDRLDVANLEPVERQRIMNDIEALQDRHKQTMERLQSELNTELQKTDGWEGAKQALNDYISQAQSSFQQWGSAVTQVLGSVESSLGRAVTGLLNGTMSVGTAIKSIWSGIVGAVASAIGQIIAKYITLRIAKALLGESEEKAAEAQASANLMSATSEIYAAHAWIPFVGVAIAQGFIAMMDAGYMAQTGVVKGITAFAVGGLIDSPTLAWMAEAGPEVVAPEDDFKDWAKTLVVVGADLQSSVASRQASSNLNYSNKMAAYEKIASSDAVAPRQVVQHIHFDGHVVDAPAVAKALHDYQTLYAKTYA